MEDVGESRRAVRALIGATIVRVALATPLVACGVARPSPRHGPGEDHDADAGRPLPPLPPHGAASVPTSFPVPAVPAASPAECASTDAGSAPASTFEPRDALFFSVSNAMTAPAIADGVHHAGAQDVAELDVNWSFPKFLVFGRNASGALEASSLFAGFVFAKNEYVRQRSTRDFFYLARR